MRIVTGTHRYDDMIEWLNQHVGPTLNHMRIIEWTGRGWRVQRNWPTVSAERSGWIVDIDDENLAILFALRWS